MTLTAVVFLILKWLEVLVLFFSGRLLELTKNRRDYWKIAIFPIIVFALVEGLRWGRLIDWNNAAVEFQELDSFVTERHLSNPLYSIILYTIKCLGLQFPFFVVLQCGFLLYSALFLLQDYKQYLRWLLPCLLMVFINNENFIRFYFSLSFALIAIYYFFHHSLSKYILFSVLAGLVHFGQIPFLLILPLFYFLNTWKIPRIIGVVLYLIGLFFVDISHMGFIVTASEYVASILGMESEYRLFTALNNMEDIISGTAYGTTGTLFIKSLTNKIASALLYVPLIWMMQSSLKNEKNCGIIYNLAIINIILTPILGQAELLHRFPMSFNIFVAISFAAVIKHNIHNSRTFAIILIMLFIYFFAFLNAPFVREDYLMYFLWDSNGALTNYSPYDFY